MNIAVNLESGDLIMVFTENENLTPEILEAGLKESGYDVEETYEVRDDELQYHCYEPLWSTPAFEKGVMKKAERWFAKHPEAV